VPLEIQGRAIGAVQLEHISDDRQFNEFDLQILNHLVATPLAMALEKSGIVEAMKRDNVTMHYLLRKVILAREEERERISHDLHDNISQTLAGLHLALANLQRIASTMPNADSLKTYFNELDEDVRNTIEATQNLVFELRPPMLDDYGLVGALTWQLEERLARTGIEVKLEISGESNKLDDTVAITLFRVAQETLNNILRHADAQAVTCTFHICPDWAQLAISDDGKGFIHDEHKEANLNLGLRGMEERMGIIGGTLTVESEPGVGTTITAWAPLSEAFDSETPFIESHL